MAIGRAYWPVWSGSTSELTNRTRESESDSRAACGSVGGEEETSWSDERSERVEARATGCEVGWAYSQVLSWYGGEGGGELRKSYEG